MTEKFNYQKYIKSEEWREKSKLFLLNNKSCLMCRERSEVAHHVSYENCPNENYSDIMALCHNCHKKIHLSQPLCVTLIKDRADLDQKEKQKMIEKIDKIIIYYNFVLNQNGQTQQRQYFLDEVANRIFNKNINFKSVVEEHSKKYNYQSPLFIQNVINYLYIEGTKHNEDWIEEVYAVFYSHNFKMGQNSYQKKLKKKKNSKRQAEPSINYNKKNLNWDITKEKRKRYSQLIKFVIDDKNNDIDVPAIKRYISNQIKSKHNQFYGSLINNYMIKNKNHNDLILFLLGENNLNDHNKYDERLIYPIIFMCGYKLKDLKFKNIIEDVNHE